MVYEKRWGMELIVNSKVFCCTSEPEHVGGDWVYFVRSYTSPRCLEIENVVLHQSVDD